MPLPSGELIAGYRIESVLGRGGMGVVYRARHDELGRSVALKVIAADRAGDPVFRARFVREARLAAGLDHPHVIPIFEAGEAGGVLFIAMRLVEGTDLARLIAERGRLAPGLAVGLVAQAAAGLDAAHARGLVHRDVKPANILLAGEPEDWHVYVSDFGAAKALGDASAELTGAAEWVGTAAYAAPEQTRGGRVDRRADVYALGCVLVAALGDDSPALGKVLARARAARPADRYDSAGALAAAALAALAGQPPAPGAERTLAAPTRGAHPPDRGPVAPRPARHGRRGRRKPGRGGRGLVIPALIAGVVGAVALVAALAGGPRRNPATHAPIRPPTAIAPAAAAAAGDTVVCHPASCVQAGRTVATPIEGGACGRGPGATWRRIDHSAPEPMLICLPPGKPPAGAARPPLPTLAGARLDRAELALDRLGIAHDTSGGGLLGILERTNWTVCATSPPAGTRAAKVKLFVDRSC